jgi:ribosomal protein S18 acetylase RimI-like enzyme
MHPGFRELIKKLWHDPVWSKVIAGIILSKWDARLDPRVLYSQWRTNVVQVANVVETSTVLGGLYGAKIVACVQIERDGSEAYIGMLAVDPALQTAGIGKAMLRQAELYAESSLGAEQFVLVVVKERNELVQFGMQVGTRKFGLEVARKGYLGTRHPLI